MLFFLILRNGVNLYLISNIDTASHIAYRSFSLHALCGDVGALSLHEFRQFADDSSFAY